MADPLDELDSMLADLAGPTTPASAPVPAAQPISMSQITITSHQAGIGSPHAAQASPAVHSMASVTMTPANGSYAMSSGIGASGGAHSMASVTMTPANASFSGPGASFSGPGASFSGPGPAAAANVHSMSSVTMTPANASYAPSPVGGAAHSMSSVTYTPANASAGPGMSLSGPGGAAGGMHSMNSVTMTPANATGGRTINLTPANASPATGVTGPGPNFSGPGASFAGPGPSFAGPGPSFAGPGPSFAGPGPSFAGPGPSFSGPGPSFAGPGPSFSGPGPSLAPGGGSATIVSSGPGANWASQQAAKQDEPIKLATKTPDGRDIIHKGPPCANCGEMIIGQCTNALGKTYHPEHFVCACCSQPFVGGKFMIKDNEPYCETDFFELFGNKCKTCGDPIRDKYVSASDTLFFHPEHFVCDTCGIRLTGKKFKVHDISQDVMCIDCHVKRITVVGSGEKICAKCLRPIQGEFVVLKGQHMHAEHFRCEECGCAFVGGNCHEFEGALYCTEHYEKLLKKTCYRCRKPILGRGVSAIGRMFHPEHFCCFTCGEMLNSASFFEKDGEAYCETHYAALFATTCDYCNKPILADGRSFMDKNYHAEHFKCSVCDNLLKSGHIREWDQKPYCDKCYMKLPSEARKKYEKKKIGELKIEKKHEVEEKKAAMKAEKAKAKEAKAAAKAAKSDS